MVEFAGKKILVVGIARSGSAAIKALARRGALLVACDRKTEAELRDELEELRGLDIELYAGHYPPVNRDRYDMVVASPGVPLDIEPLAAARQQNLPIISELELAYLLKPDGVEIYAVSGTNGKTTTVSLLEAILAHDGLNAVAAGNIGVPLTSLVDNISSGIMVVEASSFQLETISTFRPHISALLNITPDHLDRHKTMQGYAAAKAKIFSRQTQADYAVFNYEDPYIRDMAASCPARAVYFSTERSLDEGAYVENNLICFALGQEVHTICPVDEVSLRGRHNLENILCAVAVAVLAGARVDSIRATLGTFKGVRHRIEEVGTVAGVLYVNDSKATNPESALKALESFAEPIILLAGGRSKGSDFTAFAQLIAEKVKSLILLGEAREEIKKVVMETGFRNIHEVDDFPAAVNKARQLAQKGEVVLLSPACASWDMFQSYEQRGDLFCELVSAMQNDI